MKNHLIVIALLFSSLQAGPPMLSDDPFVPDRGQFEINLTGELSEAQERVLTAPILDANYGLVEDLQITFELGYINAPNQKGFDALELAFKWNFYSDDFFAVAINPKYLSNPVDSIFNEGEVYEVSVPMNFTLSENLSLVVSPAFIYPLTTDEAHMEFGSYLKYSYEKSDFFIEYFAESSKKYDDLFSIVNLGYMLQFHENIAFMLSIGQEIKSPEKEATIAYSGLQFVF